MDFLKKIQHGLGAVADFLVYSRLWLALCTICLCSTTFLFSGNSIIHIYTLAATTVSYIVYSLPFFHYFLKQNYGRFNPRQKWIMSHVPLFLAFNGIAAIAGIYAVLQLPVSFLILLMPALVLAISYILPVAYWRGKFHYLREIGALKPLMIAVVWSYVCVIMPFEHFANIDWLFFSFQFIFLFNIGLMFDNRDVFVDTRSNIKTLPILFGKKNMEIAVGAISLMLAACVWFTYFATSAKCSFTVIFSLMALFNTKPFQNKNWRFYDLMVDGLIVLQFLLIYLL